MYWSHWEDQHKCVRLHYLCSNNTGMRNHISFHFILLNIPPGHRGLSGELDTTNVKHAKPSECPRLCHAKKSPTWSSAIKFNKDNAPESDVTRKRAKVSDDEDPSFHELRLWTVMIELQRIQNALNRTWEVLANFTLQGGGKQ